MKKWMILMLLLSTSLILGACGQTASGTSKSDSEVAIAEDNETEKTEVTNKPKDITPEEKKEEGSNTETAADDNQKISESGTKETNKDTSNEKVDIVETNEEVTEEKNTSSEETNKEVKNETVWLYFADEMLMNVFRTDEDITVSPEEDVKKLTLERWIKGPSIAGLYSLVPETTVVQSVEEEDGTAIISFSPEFLEATVGSTGELFLTEQISMMMQQFGYSQTKILVNGNEVDTLFGHIDATKPIKAGSPEDYEVK